jgi:hypothetical protein
MGDIGVRICNSYISLYIEGGAHTHNLYNKMTTQELQFEVMTDTHTHTARQLGLKRSERPRERVWSEIDGGEARDGEGGVCNTR